MPIGRPRRVRRAAVLTALLAMATMFLSVAPAHATADSIACNGRNNAHYTPPLTNQPQDVTVSIEIIFDLCVSASNPNLKSGTSIGGAPLSDRSCVQLLEQRAQTITITWNTGQTTRYTEISNATVVGGVYTVTSVGVVVDGLFKDHVVTVNYTAPALDILLCTAGLGTVSKVELVGTFVIAPV